MAGYAVLRTGNPDSAGRYAMTAFNVVKVAPDIYRLDMSLKNPWPETSPPTSRPTTSPRTAPTFSGTKRR